MTHLEPGYPGTIAEKDSGPELRGTARLLNVGARIAAAVGLREPKQLTERLPFASDGESQEAEQATQAEFEKVTALADTLAQKDPAVAELQHGLIEAQAALHDALGIQPSESYLNSPRVLIANQFMRQARPDYGPSSRFDAAELAQDVLGEGEALAEAKRVAGKDELSPAEMLEAAPATLYASDPDAYVSAAAARVDIDRPFSFDWSANRYIDDLVRRAALDTWIAAGEAEVAFDREEVAAKLKQSLSRDTLDSMRESIATRMPAEGAHKLGSEPQTYLLSERYLEGLSTGESDPADLFSYESVRGAHRRKSLIEGSESTERYGRTLGELHARHGERVRGAIDQMMSDAQDELNRLGIEPSEWTKDGAWAAWDLAKQQFFHEHPKEQEKYIKTDLDKIHYGRDEQEPLDSSVAQSRIVHRHVAWEMLEQPHDRQAELIEALLGQDSLDRELAEKLRAKQRGDAVRLRSSEYAEVGERLEALL